MLFKLTPYKILIPSMHVGSKSWNQRFAKTTTGLSFKSFKVSKRLLFTADSMWFYIFTLKEGFKFQFLSFCFNFSWSLVTWGGKLYNWWCVFPGVYKVSGNAWLKRLSMTYVLQPHHFNIISRANRESRSTRLLKNSTINQKVTQIFFPKKACPNYHLK